MTGAEMYEASDDELRQHLASLTGDEHAAALLALDAEDMRRRERPIVMRDAALWYATYLQWPVFPLLPGEKRPLVDRANGFTRGFKDATLDARRVQAAWTATPEANIGVPTGARASGGIGFDVLDVDRSDKVNGYPAMADLQHAGCEWDCSSYPAAPCRERGHLVDVRWRAITPRGGMHLLFPARGSKNDANVKPGLDIRGAGGYIVVAPSLVNDKRYVWTKQPTRETT